MLGIFKAKNKFILGGKFSPIFNLLKIIKYPLSIKNVSHKESLKEDKLIKDILEDIKEENSKKAKEQEKNRKSDASSEQDTILGAQMKDVKDHKIDNAQQSDKKNEKSNTTD
jgi:hypothetical protein